MIIQNTLKEWRFLSPIFLEIRESESAYNIRSAGLLLPQRLIDYFLSTGDSPKRANRSKKRSIENPSG